MKKTALIGVLIFLGGALVFAQDVGFFSERDMKDYCERIVNHIQRGEVESAFELMKSQWLFDPAEIDSAKEKTVSQLAGLPRRFGSPMAVAEVGVERVSDFLIRFTYVVKYERHLLRWLFTFYRARGSWILNAFWWDDNVSELFIR